MNYEELTVEELQDILCKSQDSYYGGDIRHRLLGDEHFRVYDIMLKKLTEGRRRE